MGSSAISISVGKTEHLARSFLHGVRIFCFTRLILFDKRGIGVSDRTRLPTLEERMDDLRAVMDAAGCERAVVMGISEGAPDVTSVCRHLPERVDALVLWGGFPRNNPTIELGL